MATLVFAGKLPPAGVIFLPANKALPAGSKDIPPADDVDADLDTLFREADPDLIGAEADSLPQPSEPVSPAPPDKEKEKTMTLTGKLKSIPKPGRNDRSGKPTAYAEFAAHVEGEKEAHDFVNVNQKATHCDGEKHTPSGIISGLPERASSP